MRRTERQIFTYELMVSARAQHATPPQLGEIVAAWEAVYVAGESFHERERGTVVYRIGDIAVDPNGQIARILLRRCDTNSANAVYSHRFTGIPRVAPRHDDEGGDRAAHLVLSLTQEANKPHVYLCHLEGVPGLSHRLAQATLNALLKHAIKTQRAVFRYPDPSGARTRQNEPKRVDFIPSVELIGRPSAALVQDLENGELGDITLIDLTPQTPLGGSPFLTEKERRIRIKAAPTMPRQNRVASLIAAFQSRQAEFQKAKVRFTDPSGIPRSIDYDIATGTPEQQHYVQSYMVTDITPPMDESSMSIVPFLADAMQVRVAAERT